MKNFIQPGAAITTIAAAAYSSGDPALIGSLKGIVSADAAIGEAAVINRSGVYSVTKEAGATWSVGDKLYLKDGTKIFNKTASGNVLFGFATKAAVSGDVVGEICLADAL